MSLATGPIIYSLDWDLLFLVYLYKFRGLQKSVTVPSPSVTIP